ncbi:hypothetical protein ACMS1Z_06810 [Acidiphilium multivorum]|uniref:hypothetical protein n=1 Tax=Acidiphilium multivorum TaxID=62140 RepID=UPI0039C95626
MNRRATIRAGLAGAAAAVAAPAVAYAAGSPDAELIALCDRFVARERVYRSYFEGGANYIADEATQDAVTERITEEQVELIDAIVEHRATTLEGLKAVALAYAAYCPDIGGPDSESYPEEKLISMLARDVRRMA